MSGVIGWFARNGVAANLLMVFVVAWGLLAMTGMPIEVFPSLETQSITVTVPYLGAAPEEVEQGVCLRVEEAVQDLEGIGKVRSTAAEGVATVVIELESGADTREVLDQVKSRIDAITTFPEETEKPIIQEALIRRRVITVAVYGDVEERALKAVAEQVREGPVGTSRHHPGGTRRGAALRDLDRGLGGHAPAVRPDLRRGRAGGAAVIARSSGRRGQSARGRDPPAHDGAGVPGRRVRRHRAAGAARRQPARTGRHRAGDGRLRRDGRDVALRRAARGPGPGLPGRRPERPPHCPPGQGLHR